MKVLILMKEKPADEDEDQRGLFDRFFIQEKGNIIQNFNKFAESKGLEMQAWKVDRTLWRHRKSILTRGPLDCKAVSEASV